MDGRTLERNYKEHQSGFRQWDQTSHASDWVLIPENMGENLNIDESMHQNDLFTFVSNKDGHGRRGTLVAAVRGRPRKRANEMFRPETLPNGDTKVELLTRARYILPKSGDKWSARQKERVGLLFELAPKLKETYSLVCKLRCIFRDKRITKETARERLKSWYKEVAESRITELASAVRELKSKENDVLNYFVNRATNAAAESLNSKMKGFRTEFRGVCDLPFYLCRCCMIFG